MKKQPYFVWYILSLYLLYCLFSTLKSKVQNMVVFSSALEFRGHPLSFWLSLHVSLAAVMELTEQVINSGATTPNLSCCQGCLSSPFGVFCCAPSMLGVSTNSITTPTETLLGCFFFVCFFVSRPSGPTETLPEQSCEVDVFVGLFLWLCVISLK